MLDRVSDPAAGIWKALASTGASTSIRGIADRPLLELSLRAPSSEVLAALTVFGGFSIGCLLPSVPLSIFLFFFPHFEAVEKQNRGLLVVFHRTTLIYMCCF